ncbi:hypothetical protein GBAR_LOCUS22937, partial [Geodia barretti]
FSLSSLFLSLPLCFSLSSLFRSLEGHQNGHSKSPKNQVVTQSTRQERPDSAPPGGEGGPPLGCGGILLCDIGGVDDRDNDGNTCLHIASEMNWGEVVISLLERGANETLENKEHMTPLAVAEVKGHMEVADILQRKPGTVQRNRKQTLYFTDKGNSRPMSAHFMDGDIDMSTSPMTKSHKRLKKKSSSTDDEVRRSWSNLSASPAPDTAMKSPSSRSPSALLKWFHLTSPISQNGNELVNDNK